MRGNIELIIPILLSLVGGITVLFMKKFNKTKLIRAIFLSILGLSVGAALYNSFLGEIELYIWSLAEELPIILKLDSIGVLFSVLTSVIWLIVGIYSCEYFKHEERENQFFGSYLMTFAVILGIDYSANLATLYLFYELMTVITICFVIHTRSPQAISATLKYLLYSLFGAFTALVGIFFVYVYTEDPMFVAGGVMGTIVEQKELLLIPAFLCIIGFATKAGMFPLHGWLPDAHPVAPAPASAVLSGIITKSGVIAIIRVIHFTFGADFIRDTWVQYAFMALALITVIMGSVMAFNQDNLKRRLAFSTVSQVSYVLFGISILNPVALLGAFLHIIFHATIKVLLFLGAGAIIYKTGITSTKDLLGIGKKMPLNMFCFAVAALGLVGIPPLSGFISKWYLATGAVQADIPVFSWLGPILLLTSAIFTAVYLFTPVIDGFSGGEDTGKKDVNITMAIPLITLAIITFVTGVYITPISNFLTSICSTLF